METLNGSTNGKSMVGSAVAENPERAPGIAKPPPAHTITQGRVVTRIWANRTHWEKLSGGWTSTAKITPPKLQSTGRCYPKTCATQCAVSIRPSGGLKKRSVAAAVLFGAGS